MRLDPQDEVGHASARKILLDRGVPSPNRALLSARREGRITTTWIDGDPRYAVAAVEALATRLLRDQRDHEPS